MTDKQTAATAETPEPSQKWRLTDSIFVRLARAQEEVRVITQDVDIDTGKAKYKGVSASQIVAFGKRVLLDNGIIFLPVPNPERYRMDQDLTSQWVDGFFHCIDRSEEVFVSGAWGQGSDRNDKGAAKAYTNSAKQILAKVLQMTTLDDDEGDHENVSKDGTKAGGKAPKEAAKLSEMESKAAAQKLIKDLQALKTFDSQAQEMWATKWGADIATLTESDAKSVRDEFRAKKEANRRK